MNAWLPQASYPCGNFSDTSSLKFLKSKGSIGHAFTVCIHTENQNQMSFYPFVLHEISVLIELILGHLRYLLTDVPPQPNSPPGSFSRLDSRRRGEEMQRRYRRRCRDQYRTVFDAARPASQHGRLRPFPSHLDPHMRSLRNSRKFGFYTETPPDEISKITFRVVVFRGRFPSHLCYTSKVISQSQTRVKLNRVFFPR